MPPAFLHRAPGDAAAVIGGGAAQAEQATHALLRTADGGVLVKGILRQADGSFIAEVYGVTPRQRAVAVGDLVSFLESQIFTFRADAKSSPADAEMADIIRVFDASFIEAEAPKVKEIDVERLDADFSFAEDMTEKADPDVAAVSARDESVAISTDPNYEPVEPTGVTHLPEPVTGTEHQVACIECGAVVSFTRMADDPLLTSRKLRVSCRSCGRINDIGS